MMRDNWHYYFENHSCNDPGHGTTVAGAAAAKTNNNFGIASAGSGWGNYQGVQVMCLTARNGEKLAQQIPAIDYAILHGAKIFNFSMWWSYPAGLELQYAYDHNYLLPVVANGNGMDFENGWNDIQVNNSVLSVGMTSLIAVNHNWIPRLNPMYPDPVPPFHEVRYTYADRRPDLTGDSVWVFEGSNYGGSLDLVAARPGCHLVDHYLDPSTYWDNGPTLTSQTAPSVASIAGLVLANYPTLSPRELMQIILESCNKFEGVPGEFHMKKPPDTPRLNPTDWYNRDYYDPYGDPAKYLSSEYTYDATNPNGNLYGSWDLQVGYGKVSARNALWLAEHRADALGAPEPASNLHVEIDLQYVGMNIVWDASTSPDISHYKLERYKHYDGETSTLEVPYITSTSWHDAGFVPQNGGPINFDDYCKYWVWAIDKSGFESSSIDIKIYVDGTIQLPPDPKRTGEQPLSFHLDEPYPNPFNQMTTIRFTLPETGNIQLKVFSVDGRLARLIIDDEMSSGAYNVPWNSGNLSSGVYFLSLVSEKHSATRKIVLVK